MFLVLSFFWLIRQIKAILFWLYLWQLKEYRFGRFFAHFRTYIGKKLFFNPLFIFKIILFFYALSLPFYSRLLAWQLYAAWIVILGVIYFFESAKTVLDFFQKNLKRPVLTQKSLSLISVSLIVAFLFLFILFQKLKLFYWFSLSLLSLDILTPLVVSGIVLLFQPLTVYLQSRVIKKAKEKRAEMKDLIVVGITGSYGKTSTKEFLNTILSSKFRVLSTPANQNTDMAIAKLILEKLNEDIEIFIVEMAAYKRGEINSPCQIVKPKIGILTGINEQHLATFGSLENIIDAKFELIESLPGDGKAILNRDSVIIQNLSQSKIRPGLVQDRWQNSKVKIIKFCSTAEKLDAWAEDIKIYKEFSFFKVFTKDRDSATFRVNLLGRHIIQNLLLAISCAKELGMSLEEISRACLKIKPEQGGMKFLRKDGPVIIDSSYSANPDGVIGDLEYLKLYSGRRVVVMPCLIELGSAAKEVHRRISRKIAEVCDLAIITTRDYFQEIKKEAPNVLLIEKPEQILNKLKEFSGEDDVVLLEGRLPKELVSLLKHVSDI